MHIAHPPLLMPTEADTAAFAARLAGLLRPGDAVLLSGPIGAGKSALARALIRARLDSPAEEVPSPTFTLVQTYNHPQGDIWHCDLYRLSHPDEAQELGLDEAFASAICLIEWPDRLGDLAPPGALALSLAAQDAGHTITARGSSTWANRLEHLFA